MVSEKPINNDELAAFVTSTLNAIAAGATEADSKEHYFSVPTKVNFEVAVTATKSAEGGGGLKIQVFSAEGKKASLNEHISRITFEVHAHRKEAGGPIVMPSSNWMA